ncbi:hypothetical protein RHI9324_02976 [Rhizobium sp. CECT 9324]|jgi:hypothetical protein|nr:hypothetical protein RHI9324_02976 [Rhizobium sp. CECT 9324]
MIRYGLSLEINESKRFINLNVVLLVLQRSRRNESSHRTQFWNG